MTKEMRCIVCGKPAEIESFCEKHWLNKQKLFEIRPFAIEMCEICGRHFDQRWKPTENLDQLIESQVEGKIKAKGKIEMLRFSKGLKGKVYNVSMYAIGTISPAKTRKKEIAEVGVTLDYKKCPDCVKVLSRYHEAVLQPRGPDAERILEIVLDLKPKSAWPERSRQGKDIYFVHKSEASRMAKALRKKGYKVIRSFKLAGRFGGKDLYRDYFSIR